MCNCIYCILTCDAEVRVASGSTDRVPGGAADPTAGVQQILQQQGAGCVWIGAPESGARWPPHGV